MGFFHQVLADIGDQQSVMGDLSTFSAHLANLSGILDLAQAAADENLLILCDEIMVGTHPQQGAALARAMLEVLADAPGLVLVTTHFDNLKALAETDARFRNAGMEYDLQKLRPTFRLKDGVPGRSYAFDIAARIGLPTAVLDRARALMDAGNLGLEETLRNLQEREQSLERSNQALETARRELEQAKQELAAQTDASQAAAAALTRRERELAVRSREAIDAAVREAREAIAEIVREAKRTRTAQAVEAARAALERKAKETTAALPEAEPLDVTKLRQALADRALGVSSTGKQAGAHAAKAASQRPAEPVSLQTGANTWTCAASAPTRRWASWRRFSTAPPWRALIPCSSSTVTARARFARSCASTWRPRPMSSASGPVARVRAATGSAWCRCEASR